MNGHFLTLIIFHFAVRSTECSDDSIKRIVGGTNIGIHYSPYMLSLMWKYQHICGASIINEDWCVTAAHCVNRNDEDAIRKYSVRSGSSCLGVGGIVHNVTAIIIHENYNESNNDYDIAVVKVIPPFTYNNHRKAVKLEQGDVKNIDRECGIVCGWGYYMGVDDYIDPVLSNRLKCATLPIIEKSTCNKDYESRYTLTSRMVCYGFQEGIVDSCKGDSGGALVNKDGILIGITSWGTGCAEQYSPGIYTDTILLGDWIKNNTS